MVRGLPWWVSGIESACSAGDAGNLNSVPGLGRSPAGRHGKPLEYSCLENPTDRRTWGATVHEVAESPIWLKQLSMHAQSGENFPHYPQCEPSTSVDGTVKDPIIWYSFPSSKKIHGVHFYVFSLQLDFTFHLEWASLCNFYNHLKSIYNAHCFKSIQSTVEKQIEFAFHWWICHQFPKDG